MSMLNQDLESNRNPLKSLEQALQQETVIGKKKKDTDFMEAYPLLEQYLASKVPQRVVLDKFNAAYGHMMHPPRFRKLLLDERKRRAEAGDLVVCSACGQKLASSEQMVEEVNNLEGTNYAE